MNDLMQQQELEINILDEPGMSEVSSVVEDQTITTNRASLKVQPHEPIQIESDNSEEEDMDSDISLVGIETPASTMPKPESVTENSKLTQAEKSSSTTLIQKKSPIVDQLRQIIASPEKRGRALDAKDMRLLSMSNELRRGVLRQGTSQSVSKQYGFGAQDEPPYVSSFVESQKKAMDAEQKLLNRKKREEVVLKFEAEAKEKRKKEEIGEKIKEKKKSIAGDDPNKKRKRRLVFNTFNTNYPVIDLAAKNCGYRAVFKDHNLVPTAEMKAAHKIAPGLYSAIQIEEFDVVWFDLTVSPDVLQKIKPHQRLSQWPGIQCLSHKNKMAKNLTIMQKHHPAEYDFFPQTFLLPAEMNEYKKQFKVRDPPTFIVKPSHDCQGRGIYLMKSFDDLADPEQSVVAQTYIDDPYLVDGLKFDLRMYVLIFGIHPLRIYLFDDGLARFATNSYVSAKDGDITDLFQHLTNYAINKLSQNYVQNDLQEKNEKPCHKRSLKEIYTILESQGKDVAKLKRDINDLIVKTIITGQNSLHHIYRSCQPDDLENQMCFQILGFDVMFDSKLKPWLIEINQSPSFATDSAFDFGIKKKLMEDTFKLLNLTPERKQAYIEAKEKQYFERMMHANKTVKPSYEQREYLRFELDKKRDDDERPILEKIGYDCIFPVKDDEDLMRKYSNFLRLAKELQDQFTHGKKAKNLIEENVYDIILKAQIKTPITAPQPQTRPKTANVRSSTKANRKDKDDDYTTPIRKSKNNFKSPLDNIQSQKEESKLKEKIQKAQILNTVKRKVLEQEKKLTFQRQLMDLANEQQQQIPSTPKQKKEEPKMVTPKRETTKNPYTPLIRKSEIRKVEVNEEKPEPKPLPKNKPVLTPLAAIRKQPEPEDGKIEPVLADRKNAKYVPFHKRTRTQSAMPMMRKNSPEAEAIDIQINNMIQSHNKEPEHKEASEKHKEKIARHKQKLEMMKKESQQKIELVSEVKPVEVPVKQQPVKEEKPQISFLEEKPQEIKMESITLEETREPPKVVEKPKKSKKEYKQQSNVLQIEIMREKKNINQTNVVDIEIIQEKKPRPPSPIPVVEESPQRPKTFDTINYINACSPEKQQHDLQYSQSIQKLQEISLEDEPDFDQIKIPKSQKVSKTKLRESTGSKSVKKYEFAKKEFIYPSDQAINNKLLSALSTPVKQKPKKVEVDPSKNFMAKNMEKIAELQKQKELQKIEKQKEEVDVYSPPKKSDKEKIKNDIAKEQKHMITAKLKFLKVIEDLKAKGKDPVFNLIKDFTVNGQVGQGTFAVIKKCTHNKTKYEIALKTYEKKLLTRKSQLMAIHREIYILAGLEHPNIMKLFEVIDTKTHVNLVTEFCAGSNLLDYLKKHGQKGKIGKNTFYSNYLSEGRAKNIFRQIVSAISYMHGLGLVHRDLRIENIIVNEKNYEIKFIDFGFATSFQQNDKLQMIGGVPQYKNPEVAKTKTMNGQLADTYALGIILYIILTGGVPLWSGFESEIYQQIQADKFMLPVGENAYTQMKMDIFSAEAQDLISKMFQVDPKNRMTANDILKHPWLSIGGDFKSLQNQSTQSSSGYQ